MPSSASPAERSSSTWSFRADAAGLIRREPYRLLFPLGALLAWAGVLPWLFFAFRLRHVYEPVNGLLAYRSFLHPLAELDGFLGCFAAGVVLTALRPPPALWQILVAAIAPLISASCAALGHWQLGQMASLALLAVMLDSTLRRLMRPLSPSLLWIAFGFVMGAGGAAIAPHVRRAGLHVIFLGCFTALLLAALFPRPGEEPAFPLRKLAWAGGLVALSMVGRVMVELDPTSFHLWMGVSAASFLAATLACLRVPVRAIQSV